MCKLVHHFNFYSIHFRTEAEYLKELAKNHSVDDVADFLHTNRMDQYIGSFKEEEIDGIMLVEYADDILNDLGVSSPLHCFKIQYLFKRLLQKTPTTHSQAIVNEFLAENKMDKYGQKFVDEGIDGDMLLEILQLDTKVSARILDELGIKRNIDILRIRKKFIPSAHAIDEGICVNHFKLILLILFPNRNCTGTETFC